MKQIKIIKRDFKPNFGIETDEVLEKRVNEELKRIQDLPRFNWKDSNSLQIIPFFFPTGPTPDAMYEFKDEFLTDRLIIIYDDPTK